MRRRAFSARPWRVRAIAVLSAVLCQAVGVPGAVPVDGAPAGINRDPGDLERPPAPADGAVVAMTPPPFVWLPVGPGVRYSFQVGPAADPAGPGSRTMRGITMASHALREPLPAGRWSWRYGVESSDGAVTWSRVRTFTVAPDARHWQYPGVEAMAARVPRGRPRLFIRAEELAAYRTRVQQGDLRGLTAAIVRAAERDIEGPLPPEPDYLPRAEPERGRVFAEIIRATRPPMDAMERTALAYLLTGEVRFADEAKRRLRHFFAWDPLGSTEHAHNDEPAMWMMMRGVRAYDWIYGRFAPDEREAIERVMRTRADGQHGRVELGSLMYWFSSALRDPVARWYADARSRGPSADIMGVVLVDPGLTPRPPSAMPQSRHFPSVGLVAMHSALGDADNDVYLLFRSSPYGSYSHGHADQNTFAIEGYGEALAIASGYYPWYGSPHHEQWTRETRAKNGITFDGGQGQVKRSIRARGQIEAFATGSGYDYASGDATAAYGGRLLRAVRRIVYVRPGVFVLYDDLAAPQPVTWEWWLHALSRMEIGAGEIRVCEGKAGLVARFLEPVEPTLIQSDRFTVPPEDGRSNQWHLTASVPAPRATANFLVVLMPHRAGETSGLPRVTRVEGEGVLGVSLAWLDGRRDLIGFRRSGRRDPVRLEGVEADATAFAVGIAPGGARRWLVGQGRRLAMGDREFPTGSQERTVTSP